MSTRSVKGEPGDDVAEAARVDCKVRRFEEDRESRLVDERRAVEESGEGVVLRGELLATEEHERHVARARCGIEVAHELHRDGETTLHVARTQSVDGFVVDSPGKVVLCGHGVVVRCEDDERELGPSLGSEQERLVARELGAKRRRDELQEALANGFLASAL